MLCDGSHSPEELSVLYTMQIQMYGNMSSLTFGEENDIHISTVNDISGKNAKHDDVIKWKQWWIPRTKASDAELWCFRWSSRLSMVITQDNFRMIRWEEHCEKCAADRQTDGRTEISVHRAAWSQQKILINDSIASDLRRRVAAKVSPQQNKTNPRAYYTQCFVDEC